MTLSYVKIDTSYKIMVLPIFLILYKCNQPHLEMAHASSKKPITVSRVAHTKIKRNYFLNKCTPFSILVKSGQITSITFTKAAF